MRVVATDKAGNVARSTAVGFTLNAGSSPSPTTTPSPSPTPSPTPTPGNAPDPAPGPVGPIPPDPATVAPPLTQGVATDFASSISFLYSGSNPIQTGIQAGSIQPQRAAALHGQVTTRDGQPLAGAR